MKIRPVPVLRFLNRLAPLSARLLPYEEKLTRAMHFLMELTVLSINSKETLLIPVVQSIICRQSMDVI